MLLLSGCISTNTKVGNLFLYQNVLGRDKNPELLGKVYIQNKKLIFIEDKNNSVIKSQSTQKKIEIIKFKFNQVNESGYLKVLVPGEPELSPDGKTVVSENHRFKAVYFDDKDFWHSLNNEIFFGYHMEIKPDKNKPIPKQ